MTEKLLLTVDEAAEKLSLGKSSIYSEMAAGRLKAVKVGRARRIPFAALDAYVELLRRESEGL
jgi:excisionase family DNA binding protein